ncbi:hypothetical protein F2Q68_00045843 [Brassica cretica]|uniref:Uncharacterized protein n=1 Tax=Brassica cretica TaxID=69181 RepID=A0A8S9LK75_BRACR|nr:hypothetical protein F2Q68_00045843 [Brassica cretica]
MTPELVLSELVLDPSVLEGQNCRDGSRESLVIPVSTFDRCYLPGCGDMLGREWRTTQPVFLQGSVAAIAGALLGLGVGFKRCVASCISLALVAIARLCGTSYSGDDMGSSGIRGNKENLTFPWSSSKVENGNRFQRSSKTDYQNVSGFVDG